MKCFSSPGDIAIAFFEFLSNQDVQYVVLGNVMHFPEIETDIDICVSSYKALTLALNKFCELNKVDIINVRSHATGIRFDLRAIDSTGDCIVFPGPDVWFFPTWRTRGNVGISFSKLIAGRVVNEFGFAVPSPDDAFCFYLIKRIDRGDLSEDEGEYLSYLWRLSPDGVEKIVRERWPEDIANVLMQAAETNSWGGVQKAAPRLRRKLERESSWDSERTIWILKRFLSRVLHPTGIHIVFLGPDGSGKTSVIEGVSPALTMIFSSVSYYHFRPSVGLKVKSRGPVVDPHGQSPRGWFFSTLKLIYLWLDYSLGWWAKIWPKKFRSGAVVFDRYYPDLLVDPLRYRYGGSTRLARIVNSAIPKPDLCILLDAPPELLQARKKEVAFEETLRQRDAYLKLVSEMQNGVVIDASQPLALVIRDTKKRVFDYMSVRTGSHHG